MTSIMFKTKVKPRSATEWFPCRVIFIIFFLLFALTDKLYILFDDSLLIKDSEKGKCSV